MNKEIVEQLIQEAERLINSIDATYIAHSTEGKLVLCVVNIIAALKELED